MADATSLYISSLGNIIKSPSGSIQGCAGDGTNYPSKCQWGCSFCTDCFSNDNFSIVLSSTPIFTCVNNYQKLTSWDVSSTFSMDRFGGCERINYNIGSLTYETYRYAGCTTLLTTDTWTMGAYLKVTATQNLFRLFYNGSINNVYTSQLLSNPSPLLCNKLGPWTLPDVFSSGITVTRS